jgi:cell wall-associated NlpC family hydrolase
MTAAPAAPPLTLSPLVASASPVPRRRKPGATNAAGGHYDVAKVTAFLRAQLGKPYRWAAAGPNAFDCSGLSMRAFAQVGYTMPHNSMLQYLQTVANRIASTDSPPPGALCFFGYGKGPAAVVHHVGVSIGGGYMIEAPHTGAEVKTASIADEHAPGSGFTFYAVTNPLHADTSIGLTRAEQAEADRVGHGTVPPLLALYLAATRWQESGSVHGNYREPNGQGAYQIIPSTWQAATRRFGIGEQYPTAGSAPPRVQDQIAAARATDIYNTSGEHSWRLTARVWNGGSTTPVSNPALGPGATSDTYATQVIAKMTLLREGGGNASALTHAEAAGTAAGAGGSDGCIHVVHLDLKITSTTLCFDRPLALVAMGGGGLLIAGSLAFILVATLEKNKTVRDATAVAATALPVGRAAKVLTGAAGARRKPAPTAAPAPAGPSPTEARRAEVHTRRLANIDAAEARRRTAARRQGRVAAQRYRHREDSHADRLTAASARRARSSVGRPTGGSIPGIHADPPRRPRPPARPLPDEPPF